MENLQRSLTWPISILKNCVSLLRITLIVTPVHPGHHHEHHHDHHGSEHHAKI